MKKTVVLLLALCLLTGCAGAQEEDMNIVVEDDVQEEAYNLIEVKKGDITSEVSIRCKYMPKEKITCAFEGQEREITEVLVEKGDFVKKGDVLARQDVEEFEELILEEQHAIEMQELTLEQLKKMEYIELELLDQTYEFQREEAKDGEEYRLNREKMVQSYKEKMEDCQDAILVHNMKLQEYRQNVKEGTMIAPASGVITISQVDLVGTISKPSEKVITMIANDALIFVSEEADKKQYLEYGQTYNVLVGKGESQKVVEVTLMEEEETEYEDAAEEICFAIQTPDLKLETGAQGVIWITLEEKKDVLYVPNEVLHTGGGKTYVYTMSDNGIRNINYVTTGVSDREKTEIVEGLSEGQYVLQE